MGINFVGSSVGFDGVDDGMDVSIKVGKTDLSVDGALLDSVGNIDNRGLKLLDCAIDGVDEETILDGTTDAMEISLGRFEA